MTTTTARLDLDQRGVGRLTTWGMGALALAAFATGAPQLYAVGRWAGLGTAAVGLPVVLDLGLVLMAISAAVARARHAGAALLWTGTAVLTALSTTAQAVHSLDTAAVTGPALAVAVATGACPPVVTLWATEAWIRLAVSGPAPRPVTAPVDQAPSPVATPDDQVATPAAPVMPDADPDDQVAHPVATPDDQVATPAGQVAHPVATPDDQVATPAAPVMPDADPDDQVAHPVATPDDAVATPAGQVATPDDEVAHRAEAVSRARQLLADGASVQAAADALGLSRTSLRRWLKVADEADRTVPALHVVGD